MNFKFEIDRQWEHFLVERFDNYGPVISFTEPGCELRFELSPSQMDNLALEWLKYRVGSAD